jgi:hypothetical protein
LKCPGCDKEIQPDQQEYYMMGEWKIPLPCPECLVRIKKEIADYPTSSDLSPEKKR